MDTVAACGDVCRNVLCTSRPDVCLLAQHATSMCVIVSFQCCWENVLGKMNSPKKSGKIQKVTSGLLALKKSIFPLKTEFAFSVFPTASWTLLAWFETRGSKELHNEILHYTYDIHDHCLPRFLVKRHLNEWKKRVAYRRNHHQQLRKHMKSCCWCKKSLWQHLGYVITTVKNGISYQLLSGCRIFFEEPWTMKVSPANPSVWLFRSFNEVSRLTRTMGCEEKFAQVQEPTMRSSSCKVPFQSLTGLLVLDRVDSFKLWPCFGYLC